MSWKNLLDYTPTHQVSDSHQPPGLWDLVEREADQETLVKALRDHAESGGSIEPDLGLEICDLLQHKKPAHRPELSKSELQQRSQTYEIAALELGRLRVACILEGKPKARAEDHLVKKWGPILEIVPDTTPWRNFLRHYRKAIYIGELRELEHLLKNGEITIESEEYQRWFTNIDHRHYDTIKKACERLELLYK